MKFPVLTNKRKKKISEKEILGKGEFIFNKKYNFIINSKFESKIIKYDKSYNNEQSNSIKFQSHLNNVVKVIKKNFEYNQSIIEIGCGKGFFFDLLNKNKFKNIRGFDKTYEGKNSKIIKRYINNKDYIPEDLIVLRHTLEHIPNFFEFLKLIKDISSKKTKILIEVPSVEWILRNKAFWDFNYEHVNYFSIRTFEGLFKKIIYKDIIFEGQYILIIAEINSLNLNFLKQTKKNFIKFDIFKKFNIKKKIDQIFHKKKNIYFWGGATKTLMFLVFVRHFNKKLLERVANVIDIDKKKHNLYLQIVNKKIISPLKFVRKSNNNDLIVVSNPNYYLEVKNFLLKNRKNHILLKKL